MGDKNDVHCVVFYGFQNAPIHAVPYTYHLETAQYVFLHSSLFFSFCCSPLRTLCLILLVLEWYLGTTLVLPNQGKNWEQWKEVGRSNNRHLRNDQKNMTQPEQGTLRGQRRKLHREEDGRAGLSLRVHKVTVLNARVWPPAASAREGYKVGTEKPNTGLLGRELGKERQDVGLGAGRRALVSAAPLREDELQPAGWLPRVRHGPLPCHPSPAPLPLCLLFLSSIPLDPGPQDFSLHLS